MHFPDTTPVIERLIDQGAGAILAGAPGVGKTWAELTMSRATASGETFVCHFPTSPGPVLIVDEESNIRRLQERLRMMEAAKPIGNVPIYFVVAEGIRLDTEKGLYAVD